MKYQTLILLPLILTILGCSASTGSRYDKTEKEEKEEKIIKTEETIKPVPLEETFDITPYMEEFDIEELPENMISTNDLDLWFDYDNENAEVLLNREIIDKVDGYRVQVIATDNLEEANEIRAEIYSKTNQKYVYIEFDPPFYKVKTGDFREIADARNLSFKLNQMGYKESRVVTEKVNVYK